MKYGVREIADVVFKAKSPMKVGNRIFYKDEPVMYFDTLKTSSLEAAASTVYAQGGKGNPRLVAWDGDRTLTFNMEDALISSEGLQILSGAGLMEASTKEPIQVHATSRLAGTDHDVMVTVTGNAVTAVDIYLPQRAYWPLNAAGTAYEYDTTDRRKNKNFIYIFPLDEYGEVWTEPYIPNMSAGANPGLASVYAPKGEIITKAVYDGLTAAEKENYEVKVSGVSYVRLAAAGAGWRPASESDGTFLEKVDGYHYSLVSTEIGDSLGSDDLDGTNYSTNHAPVFGDDIANIFKTQNDENVVLVDYYVTKTSKTQQIDITADKFGGSFYIEGDTLFRTQQGIDMPAEFIIPNGKIQSNFTFSMAATGDPSTFTFTVDAMPDYTRFDKEKKVLAAIQLIQDGTISDADRERTYTSFPDGEPNSLL